MGDSLVERSQWDFMNFFKMNYLLVILFFVHECLMQDRKCSCVDESSKIEST